MKRISGLIVVLALAGLLVLGALFLLDREPQVRPPATPTPVDTPLAFVDDQAIGLNFWAQAYLLDQVMSHLAGQPSPAPRETLERLINELLLLERYSPEEMPPEADVVQRVAALEMTWGVDAATVDAHLAAAGLSREVLASTVARLLLVESAQAKLVASGEDPQAWISDARAAHQVRVEEALFSQLVPPVALTPTPEASVCVDCEE